MKPTINGFGGRVPPRRKLSPGENFHILPQPPILSPEPLDLGQLVAGDSLPLPGIDLRLATRPPVRSPH
jgi:hypothetical protein